MKTVDPDFEEGAIAYYRETELTILPCRIVRARIKAKEEPRMYQVRTNAGLFIDIPAFELWTGWEVDFPSFLKIDWGNVVDWTEEQIVEELADDEKYFDEVSHFEERWKSEVDVDYYEKLATEYEFIK
jgi:hypothetical protein